MPDVGDPVLTCHWCRYAATDRGWQDYACPACGALNIRLFRREHLDPAIGERIGANEIAAEYRAAGIALPGWLP